MAVEDQDRAQDRQIGEATQRELDRTRQRRESEQREAERQIEEQNARTETHRREFDESDQGRVHRQIEEAERLMRGPTPVQHSLDEAGNRVGPGNVPGDPTKGPSH